MAYSDNQIIEALQASGGNIAAAARALDCSRTTVHNRIKQSHEVNEAYTRVNEANLDKAESRLMDLVDDPDHKDHFKALRFYLRTKGRDRGYILQVNEHVWYQNQQPDQQPGEQVDLSKLTDDELDDLERLVQKANPVNGHDDDTADRWPGYEE